MWVIPQALSERPHARDGIAAPELGLYQPACVVVGELVAALGVVFSVQPPHGTDIAVPAWRARAVGIEQFLPETVGGDARRPSVQVVGVGDVLAHACRGKRAGDPRQSAQRVIPVRQRGGCRRTSVGDGQRAAVRPVGSVVGVRAAHLQHARPGRGMLGLHAQWLARVGVRGARDVVSHGTARGPDLGDVVPGVVVHGGVGVARHAAVGDDCRGGTRLQPLPEGRVDGESGDGGCRQGGRHAVVPDERVTVVVRGGVERLGAQREVVHGIPARGDGGAVVLGIHIYRPQRFRRVGEHLAAHAADARAAEPVGDGVRPLEPRPLVAVLDQDAGARAVVDAVYGVASRQFPVDAVPLPVIAVDVRVLLHHPVGVGDFARIGAVVREDVRGEDGRDDVGDVARLVVDVIRPALTRLADDQPSVEVGVFGTWATVLVHRLGAEVLHVRQRVHEPCRVGVGEHAGTHVFAVGDGHLPAVALPLRARLVLRGGLHRQEAVVLRAGEGRSVGILRLGQAGNGAADDEGAVGRGDGQPVPRPAAVLVILMVDDNARQNRALECLYLLHDVAQTVVVDALRYLARAAGREEGPGNDVATGHILRQNGDDAWHRQEIKEKIP